MIKHKKLCTVLSVFAVILVVLGIAAAVALHRVPIEDSAFGEVVTVPTYDKVQHGYTSALVGFLSEDGKCTVAATVDENGHSIVGRNLDLQVSNKAVFLYRTKQDGLYETIGVVNFAGLGDDTDVIIEKGIPRWYYEMLPDMAADVMNSEGLFVEQNERISEYDDGGNLIWACKGTNPGADVRVPNISVPEYLCEHCKDVDEAVELAKAIDIYSFIGMGFDSNFAFLMADASGHCGVLEVMDEKVIWNEGQPINTNFYFAEGYAEKARYGQGQGRYEVAEEMLPKVKNLDDMKELMLKTSYYQSQFSDICQYDCRYEYTHEGKNWTVADLEDPGKQDVVMGYIGAVGEWAKNSTRQEIVENGDYFESVYTNLVDCTDKTFRLYFHENPGNELIFGF